MTVPVRLLTDGAQLLRIDPDDALLFALANIAPHWKTIAQRVRQANAAIDVASPEALLTYVNDSLDDAVVTTIFDELGLGDALTKLTSVRNTLADRSTPWGKLLAPCAELIEQSIAPINPGDTDTVDGDNRGRIVLPLATLDEDATASNDRYSYTLGVTAEAAIECEAGAAWPFARDAVMPGLLLLTAEGKLGGKGKAALPFAQGSVSASAQADAAINCSFFFRPDTPSSPFVVELLKAVPAIPDPFDLDSIWHAMALSGLDGMILEIGGDAEVEVALSIGKSAAIPELFSATVLLGATVGVSRKADWLLSVRAAQRDAANRPTAIALILSHEKSALTRWGLGLDIGIDATPLMGRVHSVLVEATKGWGKIATKIKPMLHPGTFIRTELAGELGALAEGLIGDAGIRDGLVADLSLVLGIGEAGDALALSTLLSTKIGDALGSVSGLLSDEAEAKADEVVDALVRHLPSVAREDVRSTATAKLKELISKAQGLLTDEVKKIAPSDRDLKALIDEVKELGIAVTKAGNKLDTALAGVRSLIETYETYLHKAVEETGKAANAKIALNFKVERRIERGTQYEIVATLTANSAEAQDFYRAVSRGRLEKAQKLFDAGGSRGDVVLNPQSSVGRFARRSTQTGYELVLFGVSASAKTLISGSAKLTLLHNGNISVSGKASAEREASSKWEARSVAFVSAFDLLLLKLADRAFVDSTRSLTAQLQIGHDDPRLKRGEVKAFLEGLATSGLIENARVTRAVEIYDGWLKAQTAAGGKHAGGSIEVAMIVPPAALTAMIDLGDTLRAEAATASSPTLRQIYRLVATKLIKGGTVRAIDIEADIRTAYSKLSAGKPSEDLMQAIYALRKADLLHVNSVRRLRGMLAAAKALETMLVCVSEIYHAVPASSAQPGSDGWTEKDYARAEERLADSIEPWLLLNQRLIFWFDGNIHPQTLAFLTILAGFARPIGESGTRAEQLLDPHAAPPSNALIAITMTPAPKGVPKVEEQIEI